MKHLKDLKLKTGKKQDIAKILFWVYLAIIISVGLWFAANDPGSFVQELYYIMMIMVSVVIGGKLGLLFTFGETDYLTYKRQLIIGIMLAVMITIKIIFLSPAHMGIINAPTYATYDQTKNAYLSAQPTSIGENLFMFGFLFPLSIALLNKKLRNIAISVGIAIVLIGAFVFPTYHHLMYGTNEEAVFSVITLGVLGCTLTAASGSLIMIEFLHSVNNFVTKAFGGTQAGFI